MSEMNGRSEKEIAEEYVKYLISMLNRSKIKEFVIAETIVDKIQDISYPHEWDADFNAKGGDDDFVFVRMRIPPLINYAIDNGPGIFDKHKVRKYLGDLIVERGIHLSAKMQVYKKYGIENGGKVPQELLEGLLKLSGKLQDIVEDSGGEDED